MSIKFEPTHRHKKGGLYRVLCSAKLEADESDVIVYYDREGNVWVRSKQEFYDGRFKPLSNHSLDSHLNR